MKPALVPACLSSVFLLAAAAPLQSQDAAEADPSHVSPDGRFRFVAFSPEEVDAGRRPAFGIVEIAGGRLVSDPGEPLGDASRPEETIRWAPDSRSYALTTRIGTRHLDTYLYRWDGKAFVRAPSEGLDQLEAWSDEVLTADKRAQGFSDGAGLGQCLAGDLLVERWLDPWRILFTFQQAYVVGEGDREGTAAGSARAIVHWHPASGAYRIERRLPVAEPWPSAWPDPDPFQIEQATPGGADSIDRVITVRNPDTGATLRLEAENWVTAPTVLERHGDWPQLELASRGPSLFLLRRLYRVVDGAYRCVRVDELTEDPRLAPEGAAPVDLDADEETERPAYLLRTRRPGPEDSDTYESFLTEFPSPDGKWRAVFSYHPQYLHRIGISPATSGSDSGKGKGKKKGKGNQSQEGDGGEPQIVYDFDSGDGNGETHAYVVWSPDSRAVALFRTEGPRVGGIRLYRLEKGAWTEAPRPEVDYGFLKPARDAGADWFQQYERPLWWNSPRELVLELDGTFRGEEAPDYRALATLSWDPSGRPLRAVTVAPRAGAGE